MKDPLPDGFFVFDSQPVDMSSNSSVNTYARYSGTAYLAGELRNQKLLDTNAYIGTRWLQLLKAP